MITVIAEILPQLVWTADDTPPHMRQGAVWQFAAGGGLM
jgi:hypothetical protein